MRAEYSEADAAKRYGEEYYPERPASPGGSRSPAW